MFPGRYGRKTPDIQNIFGFAKVLIFVSIKK